MTACKLLGEGRLLVFHVGGCLMLVVVVVLLVFFFGCCFASCSCCCSHSSVPLCACCFILGWQGKKCQRVQVHTQNNIVKNRIPS